MGKEVEYCTTTEMWLRRPELEKSPPDPVMPTRFVGWGEWQLVGSTSALIGNDLLLVWFWKREEK